MIGTSAMKELALIKLEMFSETSLADLEQICCRHIYSQSTIKSLNQRPQTMLPLPLLLNLSKYLPRGSQLD